MRLQRFVGHRVVTKLGYAAIYQPDHHRAVSNGYVLEHILVVEKATGIILREPAQVHHVNRDKLDNSPGNLVVCENNTYHALLHSRQRALEAGYPPHYRVCRNCHEFDDPANMSMSDRAYRHRESGGACVCGVDSVARGD